MKRIKHERERMMYKNVDEMRNFETLSNEKSIFGIFKKTVLMVHGLYRISLNVNNTWERIEAIA
jgi:hypothetical protein